MCVVQMFASLPSRLVWFLLCVRSNESWQSLRHASFVLQIHRCTERTAAARAWHLRTLCVGVQFGRTTAGVCSHGSTVQLLDNGRRQPAGQNKSQSKSNVCENDNARPKAMATQSLGNGHHAIDTTLTKCVFDERTLFVCVGECCCLHGINEAFDV